MHINCTFDTRSATEPVFFGEGTYDEMCFIIMAVYPYHPSIPTVCVTSNGIGVCNGFVGDMGECDITNYFQNITGYYTEIIGRCDPNGLECKPRCQEALNDLYVREPCLSDRFRHIVTQWSARTADKSFVNMLVSCTKVPKSEYTDHGKSEYENSLCVRSEPCYGKTCGSSEIKAMTALTVAMLAVKAMISL